MKKFLFTVTALVLLLFHFTDNVSASNGWISNGPYGGDIRKIVSDPNNPQIVYTVTGGGFFRSTNEGQSWQRINNGLNVVSTAWDLAIDPHNSNHLLIAMWSELNDMEDQYNRGIFESFDAGFSWQNLDILNPKAMAVAFDSLNSNIIYAGTEAGVLKSTDGGASWSWKTQDILYYVNSIVIDPNNSSVIYAVGGFGSVLYKSIDQGETWQWVPIPVMPGEPETKIHTVLINPGNSNIIYFAVEDRIFGGGGLYKSSDAGATIQKVFGEWPDTLAVTAVRFLPGDNNTLYITTKDRLFVSHDAGATWLIGTSLPTLQANDFQFVGNSLLLGASSLIQQGEGGLFRSPDGGLSWSISHEGITAIRMRSIATDPIHPEIVYAGSDTGDIYKSLNSGNSWFKSANIATAQVADLVINPQNPNIIYAICEWMGIFKSTDAGLSWTQMTVPPPSGFYPFVQSMLIDPINPDTLYAANATDLIKSTDGGNTWTSLYASSPGLIRSLAFDPNDSTVIYAVKEDNTFLKITQSGIQVSYIPPQIHRRFYALAVDPGNSNTIFVGSDRRVNGTTDLWKSIDGGLTWSLWINGISPLGSNTIYSLKFDPVTRMLYAGTMHGLFLLAADQDTWIPAGFTQQNIVSINITTERKIYFATAGLEGYLFRGGASVWQNIPSGDIFPPQITINSPAGTVSTQSVSIDVLISDPSGVSNYSYTFDGTSISNTSTQIDLTYVLPGSHTFLVEASDSVGNNGSASSVFTYSPNATSITDAVDQMYEDGAITQLGNSIYSKLSQAQAYIDAGSYDDARAILEALINQIEAQIDIHVDAYTGGILIQQIQYLINSLP